MTFASSTKTVVVTGTWVGPDGTPAQGTVDFQLKQSTSDVSSSVIYTTKVVTATLNSAGSVNVTLIADDASNLSVSTSLLIVERFNGVRPRKWETIIHATSNTVDLANLAPAVFTPNYNYALVSDPRLTSIYLGTGAPSVTAPVGSLYLRQDGGGGTTLYVKESGGGTAMGWVCDAGDDARYQVSPTTTNT
jgi:hypothetical protein